MMLKWWRRKNKNSETLSPSSVYWTSESIEEQEMKRPDVSYC